MLNIVNESFGGRKKKFFSRCLCCNFENESIFSQNHVHEASIRFTGWVSIP